MASLESCQRILVLHAFPGAAPDRIAAVSAADSNDSWNDCHWHRLAGRNVDCTWIPDMAEGGCPGIRSAIDTRRRASVEDSNCSRIIARPDYCKRRTVHSIWRRYFRNAPGSLLHSPAMASASVSQLCLNELRVVLPARAGCHVIHPISLSFSSIVVSGSSCSLKRPLATRPLPSFNRRGNCVRRVFLFGCALFPFWAEHRVGSQLDRVRSSALTLPPADRSVCVSVSQPCWTELIHSARGMFDHQCGRFWIDWRSESGCR
jgi:hypothetical protein